MSVQIPDRGSMLAPSFDDLQRGTYRYAPPLREQLGKPPTDARGIIDAKWFDNGPVQQDLQIAPERQPGIHRSVILNRAAPIAFNNPDIVRLKNCGFTLPKSDISRWLFIDEGKGPRRRLAAEFRRLAADALKQRAFQQRVAMKSDHGVPRHDEIPGRGENILSTG